MDEHQLSLWSKIQNFELDDPESPLCFTDRLSRENGWSTEYALRAIEEYKRFIFLLCITNHPLTPSDQVDQVWHLHLIYTKSYWIDLCQNTINKPIHHGPTKGGKSEKDKYEDFYAFTLNFYTSIFKTPPPPAIWPDSKTRFNDIHYQRINIKTNWIIRKPTVLVK